MFFNYKPKNQSSSCSNRIKSCFQDWISQKKVLNWFSKRLNSTSVDCVCVCVFSVLLKIKAPVSLLLETDCET